MNWRLLENEQYGACSQSVPCHSDRRKAAAREFKGKANANQADQLVEQKVRQAIIDIVGTMPEKLAPAEDIVKVGRRMAKAIEGHRQPSSKKET